MPKAKAKATKGRGPKRPPKTVISIWIPDPKQKERIERAVELVGARTGFAVTQSAWLLSVVMAAVENEERAAAGR